MTDETPNQPQPSSPSTPVTTPQWDESVVLEYEARVEPFTGIFVQDMLEPIFAGEKQQQQQKQQQNDHTKPSSFLDVGCGCGIASLLAAQNGFQVVATDVSEGMIRRVRQRVQEKGLESSIECLVADGQNLSADLSIQASHKKFDYAMAAFSIIFFPDPAQGVSEVYKLLSDKGGQLCLSAWGNSQETPAFQIFPDAFAALQSSSQKEEENPTSTSKDYTAASKLVANRMTGSPATLQSLLETAGFVDVKIVGPVTHHVQVASAEEYYNRFALTSPPTRAKLDALSKANRLAVKQKVMELAQERGGGVGNADDASISIPASAYFAYGTKRT